MRSLEGRKCHLILRGKWVTFEVYGVDKGMSGWSSLRVSKEQKHWSLRVMAYFNNKRGAEKEN